MIGPVWVPSLVTSCGLTHRTTPHGVFVRSLGRLVARDRASILSVEASSNRLLNGYDPCQATIRFFGDGPIVNTEAEEAK